MSKLIRNFANLIFRGAIIRKAQEDSVNEFIGCEVLELLPGAFGLAVGIIASIEWDSSYKNYATGQEGEWVLGVRFLADGRQTRYWGTANLLLTGTKYLNVDAVVKINPLYESAWQ